MTFNNRIIRHKELEGTKAECYSYCIHEVYYNDKGEPDSWTLDPMRYVGETREELWENILFRLEAFKAPVLDLVKDKQGKKKLIELK